METVLYALLFVLIGIVLWLLWDRSVGSAPRQPQTIYIQQQEAPPQPNRYEAWPRFWDAWWPSTWWGESPWNYRYSYNRLYDFGWPWRSRGSEEVHPSRIPDEKPAHRPRPPPQPVINPTIHIQLPPPVNTVTQPTQAPPALPTRSPLPEPIPTIHSGPTAPAAAPPAPTAPVQVQTPEMFVPASPPADKGYTLVTSFPDQEPLPLPTVS